MRPHCRNRARYELLGDFHVSRAIDVVCLRLGWRVDRPALVRRLSKEFHRGDVVCDLGNNVTPENLAVAKIFLETLGSPRTDGATNYILSI